MDFNREELTFKIFIIICDIKKQSSRMSLIRGVWEQLTLVNTLFRIKYADPAAKRDL